MSSESGPGLRWGPALGGDMEKDPWLALKRAEGTLALKKVRKFLAAGQLGEAASWLPKLDSTDESKGVEAEVRYKLALHLAQKGDYGAAESQLSSAPKGGPIPSFFIDERLHLMRAKRSNCMRSRTALLEQSVSTCESCAGEDLYVIGTCSHQRHPASPSRTLDVASLRPDIKEVYAAACYRSGWDPGSGDPLSRLMRLEKQQVDETSIKFLGTFLADFLQHHAPLICKIDGIVPIPTSWDRASGRGGQIPHLLSEVLSECLAIPRRDLLSQVAHYADHGSVRGNARVAALRRAWRSRGDHVFEGRSVALVDDIITTGTTLRTAARILREGGVGEVYAVALLHTERSAE